MRVDPDTSAVPVGATAPVRHPAGVYGAGLAVAGALALGAAGGSGAGAALALLLVSVVLACYAAPGLAGSWLALLLPIGFWAPEVAGVQAPALEVAAGGAAIGIALRLRTGLARRDRGRRDLADLLFAALLAGILVSGLGPASTAQWLHDLVLWASLGLVFHVVAGSLRERAPRRALIAAVFVSALVESIFAIVEYVAGASGRFSLLGGAIVYPQPQATLQHPNALGPFLVICLFLLAGAGLAERGRVRAALWTASGVVAVGAIVPFSRGAWVALAAGVLAWTAAQGRRARVLGVAAAMLALGAAVALLDPGPIGSRLASIGSGDFTTLYGFRLELAERAADLVARHPITGAGSFHETGVYAGRPTLATHPHDLLLGVAVFFGIPAALAFTGLLLAAGRSALETARSRLVALRAEAAGATAALVAFVVDGLFEYPFWNRSLTVLTVLVLAYASALGRASRAARLS